MVRDSFLMLPGWFICDDINDIIFSICVSRIDLHVFKCYYFFLFNVYICVICYISVYLVLRVRF